MRRAWLLCLALAGCEIPEFRYPPSAPVVERLDVIPVVAIPGETVTLFYRVTGATSAQLLGLADSPRTIDLREGRVSIVADETRTITLEASGEGGTTRAATGLAVDSRAPVRIVSFEVGPKMVHPGGAVRVSWQVERARLVTVTIGALTEIYRGNQAESSVVFHPASNDDVLVEIRADGDGGPARASANVEVVARLPLVYDFHASPVTVVGPQTFRLFWSVGSAEMVRIYEALDSGDVLLSPSQVTSAAGTIELSAEVGAHRYRLEAESPAGIVTEQTSVVVLQPPEPQIIAFTATPTVVGYGGETRLEWHTLDARRVEIVDLASDLSRTGYYLAPVTSSRTFLLEAFDDFFVPRFASVDVIVSPALPTLYALLSKTIAAIGEPVTFEAWTDAPATLSLDIDGTQVITATTARIAIPFLASASTTYHVVAEGPAGRTERHLSILVEPSPVIDAFTVSETRVRAGRPVRFDWVTRDVTRLQLDLGFTYDLNPVTAGHAFIAPSTGISAAVLRANSLVGQAARSEPIEVLLPAQGNFEEEPNDTPATAQGPYNSSFAVNGVLEVGRDDVDEIVWGISPFYRPSGITTPGEACAGSIEIEVLEDRPSGPIDRGVRIGGPGEGCPAINVLLTPGLADLDPPLMFRLRQSAGASFDQPYILQLYEEARTCGDAVLDLQEDCDDGNFTDGDGCSQLCYKEGTDTEPNNSIPATLQDGLAISGYISTVDYDYFLVDISPFDAGPHELSAQPIIGNLDLHVTIYDLTTGYTYEGIQGSNGGVTLSAPQLVLEAGSYEIIVNTGQSGLYPRRGDYSLSIAPGG